MCELARTVQPKNLGVKRAHKMSNWEIKYSVLYGWNIHQNMSVLYIRRSEFVIELYVKYEALCRDLFYVNFASLIEAER